MNEDYSWLYDEFQNVKTFVLKNTTLYPTFQSEVTVNNGLPLLSEIKLTAVTSSSTADS